jgi:hypothetical protein
MDDPPQRHRIGAGGRARTCNLSDDQNDCEKRTLNLAPQSAPDTGRPQM